MNKLPKELFKLLSLHSPSMKEGQVIKYVMPILKGLLDTVEQDSFGNILGEVKMGADDYTVLLSAHMDTVAYVPPKPAWRNGKGGPEIYNKAKSALGGDDKCGIAVILQVLRDLKKTKFTGTIKLIFSRSEETGCTGAYRAAELNPKWFEGIDTAIVIDRRGADNIITGSYSERFCSKEYGEFWADMAQLVGFKGMVQDGSISDTMVFSELGINGVNLSAGYHNAHTAQEYIVIAQVERVVKWVTTALDHIQEAGKFPEFDYLIRSSYKYGGGWKEDSFKNDDGDVIYIDSCDYCWNEYGEDELFLLHSGHQVCGECLHEMGHSRLDHITLHEYFKSRQYTVTDKETV